MDRDAWGTVCQVLYVADHEGSCFDGMRRRRIFPPGKEPRFDVLCPIGDVTFERMSEREGWS